MKNEVLNTAKFEITPTIVRNYEKALTKAGYDPATADNPAPHYDALPGHQRRALDFEAQIQADAYEKSNTYKSWVTKSVEHENYTEKPNKNRLISAFREYYAADSQKTALLTRNYHDLLYLNPMTKDMKGHMDHWSDRLAQKIDSNDFAIHNPFTRTASDISVSNAAAKQIYLNPQTAVASVTLAKSR